MIILLNSTPSKLRPDLKAPQQSSGSMIRISRFMAACFEAPQIKCNIAARNCFAGSGEGENSYANTSNNILEGEMQSRILDLRDLVPALNLPFDLIAVVINGTFP